MTGNSDKKDFEQVFVELEFSHLACLALRAREPVTANTLVLQAKKNTMEWNPDFSNLLGKGNWFKKSKVESTEIKSKGNEF